MRAQNYLSLKPLFIATFPWSEVNMLAFHRWAHKDRDPKIAMGLHRVYDMKLGRPVPDYTIEAFSEWLGDVVTKKLLGEKVSRKLGTAIPSWIRESASGTLVPNPSQYRVSAIAEPCEPPKEESSKRRRPLDVWRTDFLELFLYQSRRLDVPDEGHCENEEDVAEAAKLVLECGGRALDPALTGAAAIKRGEPHIKCEVEDYVHMLQTMWRVNSASVMTIPRRDQRGKCLRDRNGKIIPAGVSVITAVTEEFYGRFRSGQARDLDITKEDLLPKSTHLLISALFDIDMITKKRSKNGPSIMNTIFCQGASMTPLLYKHNISMITFGGVPESEKILQSYRFKAMETTMPIAGFRIYEFAPPHVSAGNPKTWMAFIEYSAFKLLTMLHQTRIAAEERMLTTRR